MRLPSLRTLVFWPHLIAGVTTGLVILIMSATGVALMYERQMIAWSDRAYRSVPPSAGADRLPVSEVLARARADHAGATPTAITVASDAEAPVTVAMGQRTYLLDAYTGATLGESSVAVRSAMTSLRSLHRWLLVEGERRPIARAITDWSTFVFFFILLSGPFLWLPRIWTWQRVRQVIWFKGGLEGKARDFNWHHAIGIWTVVPLIVVVFSALPLSFPWANALLYRAVGDRLVVSQPQGGGAAAAGAEANRREGGEPAAALPPLDAMWSRAESETPGWRTITLRLPASGTPETLALAVDRGNGGQPQLRSTLTMDARTGELVTREAFADQSPGRRARGMVRFLHTGEALGIVGQTVAGIATLGAVVLVWTGLALSLRRLSAWRERRRRPTDAPSLASNAGRRAA